VCGSSAAVALAFGLNPEKLESCVADNQSGSGVPL
jgi:hypothetical protein